ncbi:MAG TPA: squalene synthase HpnC [Candidatus Kapabacteria bacterium]|nr:squalene synthase HpnC [Candidatus Kapabacteria bacterium]
MASHPLLDSVAPGTMSVDEAFAYCERMAREHYENFPVGSLLVPKELRRHVHSIYAFSRIADDIADEGAMAVAERIELLDDWERQLVEACAGRASHPVFIALAATVAERDIPIDPLRHLLRAFRMDARNEGFQTLSDLLYYCYHSANPIGRLVLHLFGIYDEERRILSDKICSGLQIANFLQDLSVDPARGRINLPRDSFEHFGYTVAELERGVVNDAFREMIAYHVDHAMNLFQEGYPLLRKIPQRRLRSELTLTFLGGVRVLHRIKALDYDVLSSRPKLGWRDKAWILSKMGTAG